MHDVLVYSIDNMGRGIAKIGNKVVFIPKTLPGDRCKIKIVKEKKNYIEAELITIIESSKDRVKSMCKYSNDCGGCDFMDYEYNKQLIYKEQKVKDLMRKIGKISLEVNDIVRSDKKLNYRNKITLQIDKGIGYYKKKSYDVINIDRCMIANDKINEIIKLTTNFDDIEKYKNLMIRSFETTNQTMIVLEIDKYMDKEKIINHFSKLVDSI
ncbi:MAG TPA: class I SAM-dependent RNA methyltransferase, partial [Tenericutes bacterium]|nr:class I SAM-dependent RNA methyltransferase [Mycoplasmatota bacterium]